MTNPSEVMTFFAGVYGMMLLFFIVLANVALYLFVSWVHFRIGKKFGIGSFGEFCIPVYSWVLLCRCAGLSGWNVLWFYAPWISGIGVLLTGAFTGRDVLWVWVPVISIIFIFTVFLWGTIAERLNHSFWGYGLCIVFAGIPVYILAFDKSTPAASVTQGPMGIVCISGEYQGDRLPVDAQGLIIGRAPSQANLILTSSQISGAHLKVWADQDGNGVWAQDLKSLNGSSYSETGSTGRWTPLLVPTLLRVGTHLRLGDSAAEFVVA